MALSARRCSRLRLPTSDRFGREPYCQAPAMALVQTFGINAKRSGTLRGSCGENCVPDFRRPVVLDAKRFEFELTFPDSVHQFNAGDGN